jgi:hypothetical protein
MSKYEKAKKAARNRDAESLAWELVLTSLQDIEDGNVPDLGKSVLMELIKTVSAGHRNDKFKGSETDEQHVNKQLQDWTGSAIGHVAPSKGHGTPKSAAAAIERLKAFV